MASIALARAAYADPSNATCETAKPITFPTELADSTKDVTVASKPGGCGVADDYAAWYSFTAPADGRYLFVTDSAGGLTDSTIAFFGSCDANALACVDDPDTSLFASKYRDMLAGEQVLVRVAGWGAARGDFTLTLAHPEDLQRPPNDECSGAIQLVQGKPVASTTLHSTGTDDSSSCGTSDTSDIWYTFTAPTAGDYDFFLTKNEVSANIVSVQTGCGTGEIACGLHDTTAHLDAAETVFVRVGTDPNASDSFNVNVGPVAPIEPPPNDDFTSAIPLAVPSTTIGSTEGATEDALNWGPTCTTHVNPAVWYSFTAPTDGVYVFDTNGSAMEHTALAIFDACDSNGGIVPPLDACDFDGGEGEHSRIDGFMSAGQSICIAVAGFLLDEHGSYELNVDYLPSRPPNDHCEGALPLTFPGSVSGTNVASEPEPVPTQCPTGDFALWYSFEAPEDGHYKFDTKESVDAQPGIALYTDCGTEPIECEEAAFRPSASLDMKKGDHVRVRLSTSAFLRNEMALRVGPEPTPEPTGGAGGAGGAPASTVSTAEATGAGGAGPHETPPPEGGCTCTIGRSQRWNAAWVWLAMALASLRLRARRGGRRG